MRRRKRTRLLASAPAAAPVLETNGVEGVGWQLGNSAFIGLGTLALSFALTNGEIHESLMTALKFGGGALLLTTVVDVTGDYGDRLGRWCIDALVEAAGKRRRTPASTVQDDATAPEPSPEPRQPIESVAVRDARREMIMLLQRAIELNGKDGTQIPSDDSLGKAWGPTRRTRVVRYFGDALEVKKTGANRGTFATLHYTLGDLLDEVRSHELAPALPAEAAASG